MDSNRKAAIAAGVFFITATATAIAGLLLYQPMLSDPDYVINGPAHQFQIVLGALMEMTLASAAIGTCVTLYPYLRKQNESIALAYVCFRFFEAILTAVGVVSLLSLLTLTREFAAGGALDAASLRTASSLLRAVHDWTFILGPNFVFGIGTFLYSSLLFRSRLIPRTIAGLGMFGAGSMFMVALLELFGVVAQISTLGGLMAAPVAIYEMVLAVRLIVKGFDESAL